METANKKQQVIKMYREVQSLRLGVDTLELMRMFRNLIYNGRVTFSTYFENQNRNQQVFMYLLNEMGVFNSTTQRTSNPKSEIITYHL